MDTMLQELIDFLEARFGVDALWIFGSEARGRAHPSSDLDVAVLFRKSPSPLELFEMKLELGSRLDRPVDLVDLDRASPILAVQVLRHGRLLVDRNRSRRIRFTAAAPGHREDLLIVRRPIEQSLVRSLHRG